MDPIAPHQVFGRIQGNVQAACSIFIEGMNKLLFYVCNYFVYVDAFLF